MNFKPGKNILPSSYYTRCKLRAPPTSGVGGVSARVNIIRNAILCLTCKSGHKLEQRIIIWPVAHGPGIRIRSRLFRIYIHVEPCWAQVTDVS